MASIWHSLMYRPGLFAAMVLLGLGFLPVAVWLDLRNISDTSLQEQATDLNNAITDIRSYYSKNVVGRVLDNDGIASPVHNYQDVPGGIPIPATLSIELGDVIGNRDGNLRYRFVSDFEFMNRAPHKLSRFETEALTTFRSPDNSREALLGYSGSLFDRAVTIAAPVRMGETCVACHNTHPESPKTDWAVGDVRGIQAITIAQPIAANLLAFKYLLLYFAGAGTLGAGFAWLQWRQASRFNRMNAELEHANSEISDLNRRLTDENLRLGAEIEIARQIQMMVLPTQDELGELQKIEIAAFMEPADEVGGDYYDVLQLGDRVKVGIGDVTGHGLESGVLMLMVQSIAVALQEQGANDPAAFLVTLNRAICRNISRTRTDKHLTLSFLDYHNNKITLSGQHEELILIPADGPLERIDTMNLGFPIGLEDDISPFVATRDFAFGSGDLIILHTDGVTEAEDPQGRMFGMEGLVASANRHRTGDAKDIAARIIADLKRHIGTQTVFDDITLMVIRHR